MSRSATSTLRTMMARRGAMPSVSGSSSAAMRMRESGLRRSCDTPASSSAAFALLAREAIGQREPCGLDGGDLQRRFAVRRRHSALGLRAPGVVRLDASSQGLQRPRQPAGERPARGADDHHAQHQRDEQAREDVGLDHLVLHAHQRTRPSGGVTAIQVVGRGTPRVNTHLAGRHAVRAQRRRAAPTMRGAHALAGMAPSGRWSLTRTASAPGALRRRRPQARGRAQRRRPALRRQPRDGAVALDVETLLNTSSSANEPIVCATTSRRKRVGAATRGLRQLNAARTRSPRHARCRSSRRRAARPAACGAAARPARRRCGPAAGSCRPARRR